MLGADGAGYDHIIVPRDEGVIRMRGHETFREAVARLSLATVQAARAAGTRLDDIDLFVYHQANGRILSAVGERLGLPADRVVDCISEYGNTSAATLPLALAHVESAGRLNPGQRVLLGAFGAGFTWGATVVELGPPAHPPHPPHPARVPHERSSAHHRRRRGDAARRRRIRALRGLDRWPHAASRTASAHARSSIRPSS